MSFDDDIRIFHKLFAPTMTINRRFHKIGASLKMLLKKHVSQLEKYTKDVHEDDY